MSAIMPFWMTPEKTSENRLPARATFHHYATEAQARRNRPEKTSGYLSLNGTWRFKLVDRPQAAPKRFAEGSFKDQRWDEIQVPGCWNRQGYDQSIYTNVLMPFDNDPPGVPEENPTGLYRRWFALPAGWADRRVVIHLGGVESCYELFINGRFVGMAKDSRLPSEFDITAYVKQGNNLAAVRVIRWSDGSYLEDQDHWWMAGIHREVYLYSTPAHYLQDVFVSPRLNADLKTGTLNLKVTTGECGDWPDGWQVRARLSDPWGKPEKEFSASVYGRIWTSWQPETELETTLRNPSLWSAETPNLYSLIVSLVEPGGRVHEATSFKVGFRRIELGHRELKVNGRAITIRGVNRHDHDQRHGKTVSKEVMRADVMRMKQYNINALRTAHYPNDPYLLDLCDEFGLYVMDEANIEAHHYQPGDRLAKDPRWTPAFLDRVSRMVRRDKNHPSVIFWSLGNEAGYGANHDAAAGWVRGYDNSRVLHYCEATRGKWTDVHWGRPTVREAGVGALATDVIAPMYPEIAQLEAWAKDDYGEKRPLIMCEYSHAMGNSNGCLADYWRVIDRYPGLQGGFIWDWVDQGLLEEAADGTRYWAYGGDFGEVRHDANFNINGLVWPDDKRSPHPAMEEVKFCYAGLGVEATEALDEGRISVTNKFDFVDLSHLQGYFRVLLDGSEVQVGKLPTLAIPPGVTEHLNLPIDRSVLVRGEEAHLDVWFEERKDRPWAKAGHEVVRVQLELPLARRKTHLPEDIVTQTLEVINDDQILNVRLGDQRLEFDLKEGRIAGLRNAGRLFISSGPVGDLFRAPTDNDGIKYWSGQGNKPLTRWLVEGMHNIEHRSIPADWYLADDGTLHVEFTTRLRGRTDKRRVRQLAHHHHAYRVRPDGWIEMENRVILAKGISDVPRIGLNLTLAPGLERVEWFGRGPHENYADRKASATVGRYTRRVRDFYEPYILPQDCGQREDTRWVSFSARNCGLLIAGIPTFSFSALHLSADELYRAAHTHELTPGKAIHLRLNAATRGLGTLSCGPDTLEGYRVMQPELDFSLAFKLYRPGDEDPGSLYRAYHNSINR